MDENSHIIETKVYHSPCGDLLLGSFEGKLCLCDWILEKGRHDLVKDRVARGLGARFEEGVSPVIDLTVNELDEYFAQKRRAFDIPLLFVGTDFQKKVWDELLNIPYAQTISYGELAARIGAPKAVRAVGAANGANAISIIAPCHRVVGSNGKLTGFGGGLAAKDYLLSSERRMILF